MIDMWEAIRKGDHGLVLAVSTNPERTRQIVTEKAREADWKVLRVGAEASSKFADENSANRRRLFSAWLRDQIESSSDPLAMVGIEILFEAELALDPLTTLTRAARHRLLVVAWPGSSTDALISYGLPEHGHFQAWSKPSATIIQLDR
jgi:hypothetical protein